MEIDDSDFEHLLNQLNTPEAPVREAVDYAIRNYQNRKQIGGTFLRYLDAEVRSSAPTAPSTLTAL